MMMMTVIIVMLTNKLPSLFLKSLIWWMMIQKWLKKLPGESMKKGKENIVGKIFKFLEVKYCSLVGGFMGDT
jgi:hypothetical protein